MSDADILAQWRAEVDAAQADGTAGAYADMTAWWNVADDVRAAGRMTSADVVGMLWPWGGVTSDEPARR